MNLLFAGFMTIIGIGAGLVVASLIISKERQYYLERIDDLKIDLSSKDVILNSQRMRVNSLLDRYAELEKDYDLAINKATYYERLNRSLEQQLAQKKNISTFNSEDKDTIVKALKKAMFYSHPDRNGGKDDGSFCKYNELYKKYK